MFYINIKDMEKINYLDHIDPTNEMQRHYLSQLHFTTQKIRDMDDWDDEQRVIDCLFEDDPDGQRDMIYEFGFETGEEFEGFYRWLIDNLFAQDFEDELSQNMTFKHGFLSEWLDNKKVLASIAADEKPTTPQRLLTFDQVDLLHKLQEGLRSSYVAIDRYNDPKYKQTLKISQDLELMKIIKEDIIPNLMSQWRRVDALVEQEVINEDTISNVINSLYNLTYAVNYLIKQVEATQENITITLNN